MALQVGSVSVPVRFKRNPKSRRYILRLLPDNVARVTVPRGGSFEYAAEFARKNTAWIEKQLQKVASRVNPAWGHGTIVLLRGAPEPIQLVESSGSNLAIFAGARFSLPSIVALRPTIESYLRALAEPELVARTIELARLHNLEIRGVTVRNQRSRWGSCSIKKTISLNWRLIQTPDFVRDYIIIHELMHLREMNHSPRFWANVESACPNYPEAERWLRKHVSLLR